MKIYPKTYDVDAVFFKLSSKEIAPLNEEASATLNKIKQNCDSLSDLSFNKNLAGHIDHEYHLSENTSIHIENVLRPVVKQFIQEYQNEVFYSTDNLVMVNKETKQRLCWINFQKKYEYNPLHLHSGFLSFVIWLKIPYKIEDEVNHSNSIRIKKINERHNGDFSFVKVHYNTSQLIKPISLKIDETWEGRGVLFHSSLNHIVYPFYTSDDYRISISGNFKIK
jgi:hypothetical protein